MRHSQNILYVKASFTAKNRTGFLLCLVVVIFLPSLYLCGQSYSADTVDSAAADITQVLAATKELSTDKLEQSISILKKFSTSKDKSVAYRAKTELAAYYRTKGDLKTAASYVEEFQNPIGFKELHPAVATQFLRGVLEAAHIMVLNKDETRALQLLSWAEGLGEPYNKTLSQIKYAEILFDIDEIERCQGYLKQSETTYNSYLKDKSKSKSAIGQASTNVSSASAWGELQKRAEILKLKLKQKELEKKFGEDYGLYAYMRLCMSKGYYDYAKITAERIYTDYPKSVFAQAAKYTYGCCLLKDSKAEPTDAKRIKTAEDWFSAFTKEDPEGVYRGEAMLLLGKAYMESLWDADKSFKYYTKALEYFVNARQKQNALNLYAPLNDELKNFVKPEQELTTYDGFMRTVYNEEDPLKVYSTVTTPPWYINEQEKQCYYALGFILFSQDEYEKAREHWSKILSLDPTMQRMDPKWFPSAHTRLMNACRDKQITFSKSEKSDIKDKNERLKILFGEYLYYLERFGESIDLFAEIARKTSNRYTRLIALMGKGLAQDMGSGPPNSGAPSTKEEARQTYLDILEGYKDMKMTKIYARATFDFCASLMGYGAKQDEVPPLITEYLKIYPENKLCTKDEARTAEYWLVFVHASLGDHDKFRALLKKFDLTIKDGRTESLLSELDVVEEQKKKKQEEEKAAKETSSKK